MRAVGARFVNGDSAAWWTEKLLLELLEVGGVIVSSAFAGSLRVNLRGWVVEPRKEERISLEGVKRGISPPERAAAGKDGG